MCRPLQHISSVSLYLLVCAAMAFVALTGCAPKLSPPPSRVIEADTKMVEGCQYLGDVHGSSNVSDMLSGWRTAADSMLIGIQDAKFEALQEAQSLGATHVVWISVIRSFSPKVTGRAYNCD